MAPTPSSSTPAGVATSPPAPAENDPTELRKRLEEAKRELASNLARKKRLDRELMIVETTLHNAESAYLTDSSSMTFGNIVKGYDAYTKSLPTTTNLDRRQRKGGQAEPVRVEDRVWSGSSGSALRSLEMQTRNLESATSGMESGYDQDGGRGVKRKRY